MMNRNVFLNGSSIWSFDMKSLLSAVVFTGFFATGASSQMLTEESVRSIERLANVICISLESSGSNAFLSINANAEAEVKAILRILGGAEGSIDIDAFVSRYQNVPQGDLADQLSSAQDCRLEVFRTSREEIARSASSNPQTDKLVWTFPHMIRDGLALGVINVRASGRGVDTNYRLRNLRDETVYVKFSSMTYTDETWNVCNKGSLSTGVTGIAWRENQTPTLLPAGDSIQFSANNVRCDANSFGQSGDILATISAGQSAGSVVPVNFEIAGVDNLD